jgi:beta-galactosidase
MTKGWLHQLGCAMLFCFAVPAATAREARLIVPLEAGWRFQQSAALPNHAELPRFDDARWTAVEIPHTWNRIGNEGTERSALSNNIQGVGWYRLHFKTPENTSGGRYFLQFDAVGALADVWLNGRFVGHHAGAFARFRFDVTQFINPAGDNLLAVKADNSRPGIGSSTQDLIPLSGDFFVFGGIYRSVALLVTQSAHVDLLDFGGPGVYARALDIDANSARVAVSGRVVDARNKPQRIAVEFAIEDSGGTRVASRTIKTLTSAKGTLLKTELRVKRPRLWQGIKDPYLYRTVMTLRSATGAILDRVSEPLGLRSFKFDADRGFFLNGEHLALHGASMHQDRPVKGWAISAQDQKQDFDLLQELGGNVVRLAHYQHDQYSYELADARGIVTWAEIPLVNKVSWDGTPANAALTANARQQLTELIRQNYNHPSIVQWSVGNEIDLTATQNKSPSRAAALVEVLNALAKQEDPSRATVLADCCEIGMLPHTKVGPAAAARDPLVGIADLVGYNRYFGWYTGRFEDFGEMLDEAHGRHPGLPIAVSEYGAGAALTQHSDDPEGGPINPHGRPHPEEYQNLYHEKSWAALKSREYLWGAFVWNLFDFASDSRSEGDLTDINEKGLISYDRATRKDAFYFYRANWSAEPTLHLVGRRYVDRAYAVIDVKAYSNAPDAQLSLNGVELGRTPCVAGICQWRSLHLREGNNELAATAQIAGATHTDSLYWRLSHSERVVNIKAGDIAGFTSKNGERYGSDNYFEGGAGRGVNPQDTPASALTHINADEEALYGSYREGQFTYRIPLPSGRYHVRLKFAEPSAAAGERVFDVSANGIALLKAFDVYAAAGGKLKGVDRGFDVDVSNDVLTLAFLPQKGAALISAISINPLAQR